MEYRPQLMQEFKQKMVTFKAADAIGPVRQNQVSFFPVD